MIEIVICDDDETTLDGLRLSLLSGNLSFDYRITYYNNGKSLISAVKKNGINFQVLFMDIELGEESGIDLVKYMQSNYSNFFYVIFVTAFPDYVYSVFDVSATDFITKPIDKERVSRALTRINQKIEKSESPYILVKDRKTKEFLFIVQNEIIYIEMENSAQRLLKLETITGTIYTYARLTEFVDRLNPEMFIKIYRSIYINIRHVTSFKKRTLKVSNHSELPIGQKYSLSLIKAFETFLMGN